MSKQVVIQNKPYLKKIFTQKKKTKELLSGASDRELQSVTAALSFIFKNKLQISKFLLSKLIPQRRSIKNLEQRIIGLNRTKEGKKIFDRKKTLQLLLRHLQALPVLFNFYFSQK